MTAHSTRGRHRLTDDAHQMRFWQRYCLWHAECSCGATATGSDGAEAMERLAHRGTGQPSRPDRIRLGRISGCNLALAFLAECVVDDG